MRNSGITKISVPILLSALWVGVAHGADKAIEDRGTRTVTDDDIRIAKPHVNKGERPDTSQIKADDARAGNKGVPGGKPASNRKSQGAGSDPQDDVPGPEARNPSADTRAYGTFGIPYASGRVELGRSSATFIRRSHLSTTFPYRAIGKLTFNVGSFSSYCSASLIRRSVIVTAAHCVQDFGSGSSIFSNWRFTAGFFGPGTSAEQIKPYGTWTVKAVVRPATWANGTDVGSGAARDNDLSVMVLGKNASGQFLGDLTGWLGYGWNNYSFVSSSRTGNLTVAATATLGYPFLMDSGNIMQRADGPTYTTTVGGAGQLMQGSNFTGGSSGGPWIVNFVAANPDLSGGAQIGTAPDIKVVGVTSWGTSDPNAPKDNYSSQFRQNAAYPTADYGGYGGGNIGSLLNDLCNTIPSGNTQTYAQLGFCN